MQHQILHENLDYQAENLNFRFNTRNPIYRMTYQITPFVVPYNFAVDHKKFGLRKKKFLMENGQKWENRFLDQPTSLGSKLFLETPFLKIFFL